MGGMMARHIGKMMLGLVGGIVLLAVLALAFVYVQGVRRPAGMPEYVALGSSFASGPGLEPRAPGSPLLCARSDGNYPHILARRRRLALVDVTCAGATTEHVLRGGQYFQRAQLDAVTPRTRLVTVTIGGNDVAYLGNLAALGCGPAPARLARLAGFCTPVPDQAVRSAFVRLAGSLREIAAEVHRRSPQARLIFVDYLSVLPASGTCPRLALGAADADRLRLVAAKLVATTRDAARSTGADLVDMAASSRGHDVCAAIPWLNGRHPASLWTAPLHPNAGGMTAVAEAIDRLLG
jgi:lysophospholipase L1-like esterase